MHDLFQFGELQLDLIVVQIPGVNHLAQRLKQEKMALRDKPW